jgi:hypothetical protein
VSRLRRVGLLAAVALGALAAPARAQNTRLTLGGFTGGFGNSTVANFDAGFDQAGSNITVTVTSTSGAQSRRARVYISAAAATIGTKPISDVQWQRTDLGVWNSLTTGLVLVDEQVMGGTGATWSRTVLLRILYPWATTPAQSLSGTVRFTLEVVAP